METDRSTRRDFMKQVSLAGVALSVVSNTVSPASAMSEADKQIQPTRPAGLLDRFAVIGDTHYPKSTGSGSRLVGVDDRINEFRPQPSRIQDRMDLLNDAISREQRGSGLDFLVHIGDVVHSDGTKEDHQWFRDHILAAHGIPYFVCYGNHDRLGEQDWQVIYGHARDYAFERNGFGYIILNSSDTGGARSICIGEEFLRQAITNFAGLKGIIFLTHIPRFAAGFRGDPRLGGGLGADSPPCDSLMAILKESRNLVCCVSGHFHEHNGIIHRQGIPTAFTNHFAHYGINQYGLRLFEVYDDGSVYTRLEGFEGERSGNEWRYHYRHSHVYRLA